MEFQNSVIDLVRRRTSCRSYTSQEIETAKQQKLASGLADINADAAQLALQARFQLLTRQGEAGQPAAKLGTYGVIAGADSYIVGILDKTEKKAWQYGYLFEKIVLLATDLGLATCWLGGTFNRADFHSLSSLAEQEFIPIITPVGYARDKRTIMDRLVRMTAGSGNRKNWTELFFRESIQQPLTQAAAGAYAVPLEMIRLGPSASNKQPWRVIRDEAGYSFYLARTQGYGVIGFDIQQNDMGIAMCHFELAARELNLAGHWQVLEMPVKTAGLEYVATWHNPV